MNNFLLWVGGLLVVLLCALFAVPHFIDWNGYRGAFEETASRILGREVRVAGRVNLRILPTPFVRFEKVRLSDAEGVTGEPFFRADDFTLWLAPSALLRGSLEANRIELHRPILKLRLNAEGGGNWQTFSLNSGSLPFVLSDAALQSVSLSDGALSIDGADGVEMARVDSIGGEVTASALTGPFRFRGQANWNDEARALRLSTAAPEADGTTRFKLNVAVPKSGNTYVFDGRISDWATKPQFDGALTGSLRIADAVKASTTNTVSVAAPVPLELTAQVKGDASGVKLSDISLAFDQDSGKPQSLTGTIDARFLGDRGLTANLTSRWLDIDRILGLAPSTATTPGSQVTTVPAPTPAIGTVVAASHSSPLTILRQMSAALAGAMPSTMPARVTIAADAVSLASDTVSNVRFGLERSGDELRLTEFKAAFPGSTRVEATGRFPSAADPAAFEGDVVLRGANLGRFLSWSGMTTTGSEARNDGAFSLRSLLVTSAQSVSFRDIVADLSGTIIGGSFHDDWSKRRRVDVQLEGSTIDLSNLAPGALDFQAWRNALHKTNGTSGGGAGAATQVAALPNFLQRWLDPAAGDLNVQVRVGRLIDGSQDLRDVSIAAAMTDGRLTLSGLRFQSAAGQTATGQAGSGLEVEAEGEVSDLNSRPTGAMRGWVTAQDSTAVNQLMTLLGLAGETIGGTEQARLLAPARMAWTARFGNSRSAPASLSTTIPPNTASIYSSPGASANAPPTALDLTLDGALLGRRMLAVLRLDGGLENWRNAPLDATLTLDGPDFPRLIQLFKLDDFAVGPVLLSGAAAESKTDLFGQGRLSAKIIGRSVHDILGDLRFNDDGVDWSFAGRASMPPGGPLSADGEIRITAADLERAVAQAGLGRNASLANVVVDGSADLFVKDGSVRLASRGLTLNGAALLGDITLSPPDPSGLRRLQARLNSTDASIPRLLDLLLDPRGLKTVGADDLAWSKVPFDLARLGKLEGHLRLEAKQLMVAKGLGLQNALLEAKFDKGRIDVTALDGLASGGRFTSKWSLAPAKAGSIVAGSLTLTGGQLQLPMPPTTPRTSATGRRSSGLIDASLTLAGQGSSPAAVIGALAGSGVVELTNAQLAGSTPATVKSTIDGVMAGKIDLAAEAIERALQQAAASGSLSVAKRKLDVAVSDGALNLGTLTITTPEGQVSNRTTIDLANLKYDIEWRIDVANQGTSQQFGQTTSSAAANTATTTATETQTWPRVSVLQLGHLGEPDLSIQRMSLQSLARELTVRKMERDVTELERLRLLDEERIKVETERLKAAAINSATDVAPPAPTASAPIITAPGAVEPSGTAAAPPGVDTNAAIDEAKRRAAAIRAIEARRPQPAARTNGDPFRQGSSN
jgi:uncharacterized protein involved in outer membrane biogenesis